jgi:zinc protease
LLTLASWLPLAFVMVVTGCGGTPAPAAPAARPATPPKAQPEDQAWRAQKPEPGQPAAIDYPAPAIARLKNGLKVYVVSRPTPVVTLSVVVRHGASAVPVGKSGLAALTARMLTEGTKRKTSLQVAEAAESLGSTLEGDAERDASTVSLLVASDDVPRGLALLSEVVQTPAFSPKELERVRREWLDQLTAERQDPKRLGPLAGFRLLLGPVQGAPVAGSTTDVKRLAARDLADFHRRHYVPSSAAVVAVGNVTLQALEPEIEKLFGGWRGAAGPASPAYEPPPLAGARRFVIVDRPGAVQTALFAAHPFPQRKASGYEARQVLNSMLGGLFTSRINDNLREQHAYTYGARSLSVATRLWGAFVVMTSVKTEVTAPALEELFRELELARPGPAGKPFAEDELGRARADLANALGAHLEHVGRVAGDATDLFVHELPPDYYVRYPALVRSIDSAAAAEQAERHLMPDRLLVVVVGDRAKIEPDFSSRNWKLEPASSALLD